MFHKALIISEKLDFLFTSFHRPLQILLHADERYAKVGNDPSNGLCFSAVRCQMFLIVTQVL